MGHKIVIDGLNWVIKLYDAGGHYKIIDNDTTKECQERMLVKIADDQFSHQHHN